MNKFESWLVHRRIAAPRIYPYSEARFFNIEEWKKYCKEMLEFNEHVNDLLNDALGG